MQRYSILWADDEIDLLKPHILFLQQRGYDITPVNNGTEAVELNESRSFDVVFLDEHMPGMSGLDVARTVREIRPDLPVIIATGYITDELRALAPEAGVRALIFKANAVEFCEVIQRQLQTAAG